MESIFFIIAGGFDPLNEENERNLNHLEELAQRLNIKTANLLFMKNPTDQQKIQLLRQASMLIYTPTGEHFGIVPIEAMYMKTGVIAMNSGGPKETIQDGVTGFLISEDPIEMAAKVMAVVKGEIDLIKMGNEAKRRVERLFAFDSFKETLHELII
uniref:Glycos_transf_1 domain-containing protein n=1 Tax=Rhabditophanes sp. KR3021 TaxID=114890 RepID=A0AC35TWR9_9BILA